MHGLLYSGCLHIRSCSRSSQPFYLHLQRSNAETGNTIDDDALFCVLDEKWGVLKAIPSLFFWQ